MGFTLTGNFISPDGSAPTGQVTLAWEHPVWADDTILSTERKTTPVVDGSFSVSIALPEGLQSDPLLMISVELDRARQDIRYYAIPRTQTGTVKMSQLTPTSWPSSWLIDLSTLLGGGLVQLADAPTITTDASAGRLFSVTLGGDRVLGDPSNLTEARSLLWRIAQDGVGGRALVLGPRFRVNPAVTGPITFSTGPGKVDYLGGIYDPDDDRIDVLAFGPGY